jgi:hypothetical protein
VTVRTALALAAALAALAPAGCRQRTASPAAPVGAPAAPASDYRTLSVPELIALIKAKTAADVQELKAAGPDRYTGTVKSPDGTATLPLTVTVEAERVVCEVKTPAGTSRDVITPAGVKSDLQVK